MRHVRRHKGGEGVQAGRKEGMKERKKGGEGIVKGMEGK